MHGTCIKINKREVVNVRPSVGSKRLHGFVRYVITNPRTSLYVAPTVVSNNNVRDARIYAS